MFNGLMHNMTCGIYSITNKITNKIYIGCSKNIEYRWKSHISKNTGSISLIHKSIKKYGINSFEFAVLLECSFICFDYWEQYYISKLNTIRPNGYNLTKGGSYKIKYSKETIEKMRISHLGKNAWNKGLSLHSLTTEHKNKISSTLKGTKKKPMSEETKQIIREKRKNQIMKPVSEETRLKLSEANKGKIPSAETKQKMKESQRKRFASKGGVK